MLAWDLRFVSALQILVIGLAIFSTLATTFASFALLAVTLLAA